MSRSRALHVLVPEALWTKAGRVVELPAPVELDVARVLHRTLRQARKVWVELEAAWPEDEHEQLQQRAIQERLNFREPARRGRLKDKSGPSRDEGERGSGGREVSAGS